jgi:hypothetical protein
VSPPLLTGGEQDQLIAEILRGDVLEGSVAGVGLVRTTIA